MIQRAKDAQCSALVLTLDLQVIGQRHKDIKNGLTAPPRPTLANIINLMTKPRWCLGMAGTRRPHLPQPGGACEGRVGHELAWPRGPMSSSTRACPGKTCAGSNSSGAAS